MAFPIIPWLGGKRRLADIIIPRFPPHSCYIEVFAGGAALYFLRQPAEVEVINDINGDVVNLYRVVKNHLEEFVRQFKWALSSREIFRWTQDTPSETLTDIQRAARFYYLQHQAFGGRVQGQTWGTATTAPAVNLGGPWRLYQHTALPGWMMLGTVQRGMSIGALAKAPNGLYAQINAGAVAPLNQRKVIAVLGLNCGNDGLKSL